MKYDEKPYDKAFRSMLADCRELILPLINEAFHENYTGDETIIPWQNDQVYWEEDEKQKERITDTNFLVISKNQTQKRYHWECESNNRDHTIHLRIWEYDSQIGIKQDSELTAQELTIRFPNSAVLYLRSSRNTPDHFTNHLITPGGEVFYKIPVIKMKDYSLEEIFEKKLFFLLPFYIFNEEHLLEECRTKEESRLKLRRKLQELVQQVKNSSDKNEITNYQKYVIMKTTWYVIQNLTKGEEREAAQKEAESVMQGPVLEFEGTKLYREGKKEGKIEGKIQEKLSLIIKKHKKGKTVDQIAEDLETSVDEIRDYYDAVDADAPEYNMDLILRQLMNLQK